MLASGPKAMNDPPKLDPAIQNHNPKSTTRGILGYFGIALYLIGFLISAAGLVAAVVNAERWSYTTALACLPLAFGFLADREFRHQRRKT